MNFCSLGDGRPVHDRGLCAPCYQRLMYHGDLPPWPGWLEGLPGFAVSRYTYKGISANDLPAVWAAEKRQSA